MADTLNTHTPATDPNAGKVPEHVVEGANGGVHVDPSKRPAAPAGDQQRPAWLPEGFDTPEAFAEAYKVLAAPKAPETPQDPQAAVEKAGFDFAALSTEWAENNGSLKAETLAALEAKGITQETVDNYVRGQQAIAAAQASKLAKALGGEEVVEKMMQWAADNLTDEEIVAYEAVRTSGNEGSLTLALQGIKARFEASQGRAPALLGGETTPAPGAKPFGSAAEVTQAMRDPRYGKDPAYRKSVEARLAVTDLFG